jgi:hypothetical protein
MRRRGAASYAVSADVLARVQGKSRARVGSIEPHGPTPSLTQLRRAAEGSGFSVPELREILREQPLKTAELTDAADFAKRVRAGKEKLTRIKL